MIGTPVHGASSGAPDEHEESTVERHEPLTISVIDAAQRLGISRAFAYQLVARGELPSLRLGRRVVIPRRALEALVEEPEGRQWPGDGLAAQAAESR